MLHLVIQVVSRDQLAHYLLSIRIFQFLLRTLKALGLSHPFEDFSEEHFYHKTQETENFNMKGEMLFFQK